MVKCTSPTTEHVASSTVTTFRCTARRHWVWSQCSTATSTPSERLPLPTCTGPWPSQAQKLPRRDLCSCSIRRTPGAKEPGKRMWRPLNPAGSSQASRARAALPLGGKGQGEGRAFQPSALVSQGDLLAGQPSGFCPKAPRPFPDLAQPRRPRRFQELCQIHTDCLGLTG